MVGQLGMDLPVGRISNMPFLKNIGIQSKKVTNITPSEPMSFAITATATGSAGYFTSSMNIIRAGASLLTPVNVTFSSSVNGGTPPYSITWTSSLGVYPTGYTAGTNTSSFTGILYAGNSDTWTATVVDSTNPPSSSAITMDVLIHGTYDNKIYVGTWNGITGSDEQLIGNLNYQPGSENRPLASINRGIFYSVPDETIITVASGTYYENPSINKKIYQISGSGQSSLGSTNYFIYDTNTLSAGGIKNTGKITGFITSSFHTIAVTPSGSIQSAVNDVTSSFTSSAGVVKILGGTHIISQTINVSGSKLVIIDGVTVPTGSSDTYIYQPQSIIRMTGVNDSIFSITPNNDSPSEKNRFSNLALEIDTGSFFTVQNGSSRSSFLEMIRFRFISASAAYDMLYNNRQVSGYVDSNISSLIPQHRNIARYINDAIESANGYGSGYIRPYKYAPLPPSKDATDPPDFKQIIDAANSTPFTLNADVATVYDDAANQDVVGGNFTSRKPNFFFNDSKFNGCPYFVFNGSSEYLESSSPNITAPSTELYATLVFYPYRNAGFEECIAKVGDNTVGFSFVNTTSIGYVISFYSTGSDGTQSHAFITASRTSVPINNTYLAEIFFDGNSTNKRVGMALYNSSSLITSSYFNSTQFPATTFPTNVNSAVSWTSLGTRTGGIRYRNSNGVVSLNSTTSRTLWYNGGISFLSYHSAKPVSMSYNEYQNSIYNTLRWRYFPTSSILQRQISTDI